MLLHLTVNHPVHQVFSVTEYNSYFWNGENHTVSGDYLYAHEDANGCDSTVTLHLTTSVGVENHEVTAIYLAPNPTKNVCRIVGLDTDPVSVDFYDMRGKLVMRVSDSEFDVTLLPTGMYMVRVFTGDRIVSLKLIKQ